MKQTAWIPGSAPASGKGRLGWGRAAVALAVVAAGLAACSSTPVAESPAAAAPAAAPAPALVPAPAPQGQSRPVARVQVPVVAPDPLADPSSALAKRSVFFDFDSYLIRSEDSPVIIAHGEFLARTGARHIVIEGNTDERGSHEYNLALGQRRAEAVRERLRLLGVKDTQMEAISYGEERPQSTGQGETAWAGNRRADVVYR
jgi:peptidoglycan-associated lipoprotein